MKNFIDKIGLSLILVLTVVMTYSCNSEQATVEILPIVNKAVSDTNSPFYVNFANYPKDLSKLSIGIFDEGISGLVVNENFLKLDKYNNITGKEEKDGIPDMAGENFQVFLDVANSPYVTYFSQDNIDYLRELLVKNSIFLMQNQFYNLSIDKKPTLDKKQVKIIINACDENILKSSSDINTMLDKSSTGIKIIGVYESGILSALARKKKDEYIGIITSDEALKSGDLNKRIKEIATKSGYTDKVNLFVFSDNYLLEAMKDNPDYISKNLFSVRDSYKGPILGKNENDIDLEILDIYNFNFSNNGILCTIKNGKYDCLQLNSLENYIRYQVVTILDRYRRSGIQKPLNSLLLRYEYSYQVEELIKKVISELQKKLINGVPIYKNLISEKFVLINPSQAAAARCYRLMRAQKLLALNIEEGTLSIYMSIPSYQLPYSVLTNDGALSFSFKYSRKEGSDKLDTKNVFATRRYFGSKNIEVIKRYTPLVYSKIKNKI